MSRNNRRTSGVGGPKGGSGSVGSRIDISHSSILPGEVYSLLGKVPPAGHSHRLLSLWLERHALEEQLRLQYCVGALVDRHPDCPRAASGQVDALTVRRDRIQELLRNPLRAAAALDRWEVRHD